MFRYLKRADASPVFFIRWFGFETAGKHIARITMEIEKIHPIIAAEANKQAGASAPIQTGRVPGNLQSPCECDHHLRRPDATVGHPDIQFGIAISICFFEPVRFLGLNMPARLAFEIGNVVFPQNSLLEKEFRVTAASPANRELLRHLFISKQNTARAAAAKSAS